MPSGPLGARSVQGVNPYEDGRVQRVGGNRWTRRPPGMLVGNSTFSIHTIGPSPPFHDPHCRSTWPGSAGWSAAPWSAHATSHYAPAGAPACALKTRRGEGCVGRGERGRGEGTGVMCGGAPPCALKGGREGEDGRDYEVTDGWEGGRRGWSLLNPGCEVCKALDTCCRGHRSHAAQAAWARGVHPRPSPLHVEPRWGVAL